MSRRARTLPYPDLFAGLAEPSTPADTVRPEAVPVSAPSATIPPVVAASAREPVWVCLYFPAISLQACKSQCDTDTPTVVVHDDAQRAIVAVNRAAHRQGVFPGHTLKHALALCAGLRSVPRDIPAEHQALQQAADQLLAFTSSVSLSLPQSLLLEVSGSLRLFAGIDALLERISTQLRSAGHHVRHSVAPTPLAAQWLAGSGLSLLPQQVVAHGRHLNGLQRVLNQLDLSVTQWPENTQAALRAMGVNTLGDCRRLPRDGLSRRFGVGVLQTLGQAYGELPDLRSFIAPPEHFEQVLQLDAEIDAAPQLEQACMVLLAQLEQFLRERQGAVRQLQFYCHGWRGAAGAFVVRTTAATFRLSHWQRLLNAQLPRCVLTQPTVAISLAAQLSDAMQPDNPHLPLQSDIDTQQGGAGLIDNSALHDVLDQLRARLGDAAVRTLRHINTHQPEHATGLSDTHTSDDSPLYDLPQSWSLHAVPEAQAAQTATLALQRPAWLLQQPRELTVAQGQPCFQGRLTLLHGPERIDSDWWEAYASTRDYFVAQNPAGMRLWVYRQHSQDVAGERRIRWWLHGVFG
ncbi:MAG: DNA polymerase Y family protein [Pseudomonadota bacterium]